MEGRNRRRNLDSKTMKKEKKEERMREEKRKIPRDNQSGSQRKNR